MRIAKADLVPTDHNLRADYADFAELERACADFCERVNAREHRITRRPPVVMLQEERARLHPLPELPHTVSFGETRRVSWQSTVSVGGALYSVPSDLVDERVWARVDGSELVVVHADSAQGPREVARHALTTPGRPSIKEEHYPSRPEGALERRPRPRSADEEAFLQIGQEPSAGSSPPPRPAPRSCAASWPRLSRSPSCAAQTPSTRHFRSRPAPSASQTATWPRSSRTSRAAR